MNDVVPPPRSRWRFLRFGLRALMVFVLVAGAGLGLIANRAITQRKAVATIERAKGTVTYDWEWDSGNGVENPLAVASPWRRRLGEWLGPDYVGTVKQVILIGGQGDDASDGVMEAVGRLRGLEALNLNGANVTDTGFAHVARLTRLRWLRMGFNRKLTARSLGVIGGLKRLEEVEQCDLLVSDSDMAALAGLSHLKKLDLFSSRISDAGLTHLRGLSRLEWLQLRGRAITSSGLAHLGNLKRLKLLNLYKTAVKDLGPIAGLTALESLDLGETPVDDEGLAPVAGFTKLTGLDLMNTKITDRGLAGVQNLKGLTHLDLTGTAVTDAGLAHLAGLTKLQNLRLGRTAVSDAGLTHLAGMQELDLLFLDHTRVTDAGLPVLAGLKGCRQVSAGGTGVTDAGIAAIQSQVPRMRFVRMY